MSIDWSAVAAKAAAAVLMIAATAVAEALTREG